MWPWIPHRWSSPTHRPPAVLSAINSVQPLDAGFQSLGELAVLSAVDAVDPLDSGIGIDTPLAVLYEVERIERMVTFSRDPASSERPSASAITEGKLGFGVLNNLFKFWAPSGPALDGVSVAGSASGETTQAAQDGQDTHIAQVAPSPAEPASHGAPQVSGDAVPEPARGAAQAVSDIGAGKPLGPAHAQPGDGPLLFSDAFSTQDLIGQERFEHQLLRTANQFDRDVAALQAVLETR